MASQVELERFLEQVRAQRARSRAGAPDEGDSRQVSQLVDELALVSEMLLTAEEELRVQSEQLGAARLELDRMYARNEELFSGAPAAYAITDVHGMVVDANRAAWQLFGLPPSPAPSTRRSIVSMFAAPDRQRVRSLLGQAFAAGERPHSVHLVLAAGTDRDVVVNVEAHTDPQSKATLLRWQLTSASAEVPPPLQRVVGAEPPGATLASPAPGTAAANAELSGLLSLARADLTKELSGDDGAEAMLTRVVELACRWVPGAERASVCQLPRKARLRTLAATDGKAMACDKVQRDTEQGPAFDATGEHSLVHVDDLAQETRWRLFTTQASELGVRSVLTCELPLIRGGAATLNLYSTQPGAFTALAELIAPVFAARASIALAHADEVEHLHRAIESRQAIGQALGILVERHHLTPDQAFELLVTASKNSHMKLRDLAVRISETGEDPRDITS